MDMTINGTLSGNDADGPFSETYEAFDLSIQDDGENTSVSMDGKIQTSCTTGMISVNTQSPLLFSNLSDSDCPQEGHIIIQGEGNAEMQVDPTTGGIDVTANDETMHYDSCDEIPSCMSPGS